MLGCVEEEKRCCAVNGGRRDCVVGYGANGLKKRFGLNRICGENVDACQVDKCVLVGAVGSNAGDNEVKRAQRAKDLANQLWRYIVLSEETVPKHSTNNATIHDDQGEETRPEDEPELRHCLLHSFLRINCGLLVHVNVGESCVPPLSHECFGKVGKIVNHGKDKPRIPHVLDSM